MGIGVSAGAVVSQGDNRLQVSVLTARFEADE